MERFIGDSLPPVEMVTNTSPPTALSLGILSLLVDAHNLSLQDSPREEYYPSPVSSTGLDWKFSQDGSDHESSVDFVMSEHSEESFSNSKSQ